MAVCFSLKKLPCTEFGIAICTVACFSLKQLLCTVFWNAIYTAVLLFSKNTAVCDILECYMNGSSIQLVVFKQLSYCFEETIGLVCMVSSVTPHQTSWHNKRISVKDHSISLDFLWFENYKLNFPRKYCRALNLEY